MMITILGPTACGKTALACAVASGMNGEVISADSRQVYRHMDIGTGKDLDDYNVDGKPVAYHLIDICEPGERYNVYQYQRDFLAAYEDIVKRGRLPVLCGGSGMYIEAVLRGYRLLSVPENKELRMRLEGLPLTELTAMLARLKRENRSVMHNTTDVDTAQRAIRAIEIETYYRHAPVSEREFPKIDSLIIGVGIDRDERRRRISQRLRDRLAAGMTDEIRMLLQRGVKAEDLMYYGLEYKYVTEYVLGITGYDDMVGLLETAIHQFAKRQMTWFRGMERRGLKIHWIDGMMTMERKIEEIKKINDERKKHS